jgi:DNA-binding transcriptional LysR family regulator
MALTALDAAGVAWTEAFVGGGVATICAAVSAGLGVAVLCRRVAPPGTTDVGARLGLPALPTRDVMLYSNVSDAEGRRAVRALAAAIRSTHL